MRGGGGVWSGGMGRNGGGGGGVRVDVNGEVKFVKIQKKKILGEGVGSGFQGGCERRIEVFVKIKKEWGV